ncbi:MAG: hypothetical protein J4215_03610 [Candidatus Diapherotrites archaeon]|uniref:Uncharacterized protein n=1 Tax=Candidatus Iainarchaeum sp. TaxID=3101447 RepID=A0A8T4L541_9ARCH|nr:hypothetical protein [Candidatus Diapherotrites archaeon]
MEISELWNPQKLPEKMLERDRYVQGQLNLISGKLDRLEKVVSVGLPMSEAEDTMERLDNIEREFKIQVSKTKIYGTVLKDIRKDQDVMKKELDEKGSLKQMLLMNERMKNIETMFETFNNNKTRDVFLNMVDIMKNLETRIKTLEEISHSNASLMFQSQVQQLRGTVKEDEAAKGRGFERMSVPNQPQVVSPYGPNAELPKKKEGVGDKIKNFFNRLIGRS